MRVLLHFGLPLTPFLGYSEIEKHCEPEAVGRVTRYTSSLTNDTSDIIGVLQLHKIILTTYTEVMNSLPKIKPPKESADPEELLAYHQEVDEKKGPLHRIKFLRVVLDEAQAIKNHLTRTSRACLMLDATYRWAMSGTPIQNGLDELYPYFLFLKLPDTHCVRSFKNKYLGPKGTSAKAELHDELERFMIRRIHQDTILDAPLVKLPPRTSETVALRFSGPEFTLYAQLEFKVRRAIVRILKEAGAEKLSDESQCSAKPKGSKPFQKSTAKDSEGAKKLILALLIRLRQLATHFFLVGHLVPSFVVEEELDEFIQATRGETQPFGPAKLRKLHEDLEYGKALKKPRPIKGLEKRKPPRFSVKKWLKRNDDTILFSAKLTAIKQQLAYWMQEDPEKKIIVFTQFIEIMKLVKQLCVSENWPCSTYHGQMSHTSRASALSEFKTNTQKTILISSLTCGGIGLNLTEASRVIMVDLWWNSPVEQQAFCRVYRIGQQWPTKMVRFYVEGTIDERMLALQRKKEDMIKTVFKAGQGEAVRHISIDDMIGLAGGSLEADSDNVYGMEKEQGLAEDWDMFDVQSNASSDDTKSSTSIELNKRCDDLRTDHLASCGIDQDDGDDIGDGDGDGNHYVDNDDIDTNVGLDASL